MLDWHRKIYIKLEAKLSSDIMTGIKSYVCHTADKLNSIFPDQTVQILCDNMDHIPQDPMTPSMTVYEAASSGNVDELKSTLDGSFGEIPTADLELALQRACAHGNTDCVYLLINHRVDLKTTDGAGNTPLIIAAQSGHVDVVKLLLQFGADVNGVNYSGASPLMKACSRKHGDIVRILLDVSAILCTEQLACGLASQAERTDHHARAISPLMAAVIAGDTGLVGTLLAANACVHDQDSEQRRPLHYVAKEGHNTRLVDMFLDAGADVDARDVWGVTPLMVATKSCSITNVQTLIARGANVNIRCKTKLSCLSIAARTYTEQMIYSFVRAGSDLEHIDGHGNPPLFIAIEHRNYGAVKALICSNCRLDVRGRSITTFSSMSMFYLAMWMKNLAIMEILYQADASNSETLLECANSERLQQRCLDAPEVFERLIQYLCRPNSLRSSCRQVIRSCIRPPNADTVSSLSLPTFLKDYLLLADL